MKNKHLKELLKAIEKDASFASKNNENIHEVLSKLYSEREGAENSLKSIQKAHELISKNNELLNTLKERERLEKSIFKTTSNAALISTIGAAISATALPAAVIPVAAFAGISALGGYLSKLKLEKKSLDDAKNLIEQANSESVPNEG